MKSIYNDLLYRQHDAAISEFRLDGLVLDLGCGTTPYRATLGGSARNYVGVDWPSSLHESSAVNVFADLIADLPFRSGAADWVISFQVLEHLPEPGRFLGDCLRVLRPGGKILLTVPFMWHLHEEPHDYFRYTTHGLRYLLTKAGFGQILVRPYSGFWLTWALRFNYHTQRFGRGPFRYALNPVWWLSQRIGALADRFDPDPSQPSGYVVFARKLAAAEREESV